MNMVVGSFTIQQYHTTVCCAHLHRYRLIDIPPYITVTLGAVCSCASAKDPVEIASLFNVKNCPGSWFDDLGALTMKPRKVMKNGWKRFHSSDVFSSTFSFFFAIDLNLHAWLGQPNHIFHSLGIVSGFEKYVVRRNIEFLLNILGTHDAPAGFLFLCPEQDFRTGPSSFYWPSCPAYWSLDPTGADRLSQEEAIRLGFPPFELVTQVYGYSWDYSVYEGLCRFHQAKGFDPYGQDVARQLGLPLYQLCSQHDAPFAPDDEDFDADIDSDRNSAHIDNDESEYPSTSACGDSGLNVDTEFVHIQEIVHEPVSGRGESERTEISNCENHGVCESMIEDDMVAEEVSSPSRSMNVLMSIQLVLILFFGLSWLCDHVPGSLV
ncbi:hypothetical protein C8R45DRAFT_523886 [Mycena sanguinolenta]|nr:hypothetical protein C8R45DRAFT_523886 [Mycena sanguinolenta]